jgi:hypothetical protein
MDEERKKNIETDPILERLERERGPGGVIKLVGRFLGNSEREGYYRLYVNDRLNRYLEFPKDATIDAERLQSGRVVVWLKQGTKVADVMTREVPEDFLLGDIFRENAARAAGLPGMGTVFRMAAAAPGCGGGGTDVMNLCPSSLIPANCPDTKLSFTCNPRDQSPDCPFNK